MLLLIVVILMRSFSICVYILNILHQLFLVCFLLCFLLLLLVLSVYLLTPEEDNFLSKALVFPCFLVFRRIGEYISLDLFYSTRRKPVSKIYVGLLLI